MYSTADSLEIDTKSIEENLLTTNPNRAWEFNNGEKKNLHDSSNNKIQ